MTPRKDLLDIQSLTDEELDFILSNAVPFKSLFKRSVKTASPRIHVASRMKKRWIERVSVAPGLPGLPPPSPSLESALSTCDASQGEKSPRSSTR